VTKDQISAERYDGPFFIIAFIQHFPSRHCSQRMHATRRSELLSKCRHKKSSNLEISNHCLWNIRLL